MATSAAPSPPFAAAPLSRKRSSHDLLPLRRTNKCFKRSLSSPHSEICDATASAANSHIVRSDGENSTPPTATKIPDASYLSVDSGGSNVSDAGTTEKKAPETIPDFVLVTCAGVDGAYYPRKHEVRCLCKACRGKKPYLGITKWESHTGCRSKKWKSSVRLKEDTQRTLMSWLLSAAADGGATDLAFAVYSPAEFVMALLQRPYTAVPMKWTPERCAVCRWAEDYDDNQMLVCNLCQMAVHEECYGVRAAELGGEAFVCRACSAAGGTGKEICCCLCPVAGGALKPSVDVPGLWVHICCAWFLPGVLFVSVERMEPAVLNVAAASLRRFSQLCVVCRQVHGACIQCEECEASYHATCAVRAGYRMEIGVGDGGSKNVSYCSKHRRPTEDDGKLVMPAAEGGLPERSGSCVEEEKEAVPEEQDPAEKQLMPEQEENPAEKQKMPEPKDSEPMTPTSTSRCMPYDWAARRAGRTEAVLHLPGGYSRHTEQELREARGAASAAAAKKKKKKSPPPPTPTLEEKLARLATTEDERICCGKSAIHRWGIFAKREIEEGEMVAEYRGEVVRRSVADVRERRYKAEGLTDTYLFAAGIGGDGEESLVIDATRKGSIARLINHSCSPNCYARLFPTSAAAALPRIVLIAKRTIRAGEELTYDYRFHPERRRLPCLCGSPNCRKFIC